MPSQDECAVAINDVRCFAVHYVQSKLPVVLLLFIAQIAWSQIQAGSFVYIDFSQDQITMAADGRGSSVDASGVLRNQKDADCKILAFGDKFVFAMAGTSGSYWTSGRGRWDGWSIARDIWNAESRIQSRPSGTLLQAVANNWSTQIEALYSDPNLIAAIRQHMKLSPVISQAAFAVVGEDRKLHLLAITILYDRDLYDASRKIRVFHKFQIIGDGAWFGLGLDQIAIEFEGRISARAKDYMKWFEGEISSLTPSQKRAAFASKYIELSILLHPDNATLGFPVDVLQINQGNGVHWLKRKANCPDK